VRGPHTETQTEAVIICCVSLSVCLSVSLFVCVRVGVCVCVRVKWSVGVSRCRRRCILDSD